MGYTMDDFISLVVILFIAGIILTVVAHHDKPTDIQVARTACVKSGGKWYINHSDSAYDGNGNSIKYDVYACQK